MKSSTENVKTEVKMKVLKSMNVKSQDEFLNMSVILVAKEFPFVVPERRAQKKVTGV